MDSGDHIVADRPEHHRDDDRRKHYRILGVPQAVVVEDEAAVNIVEQVDQHPQNPDHHRAEGRHLLPAFDVQGRVDGMAAGEGHEFHIGPEALAGRTDIRRVNVLALFMFALVDQDEQQHDHHHDPQHHKNRMLCHPLIPQLPVGVRIGCLVGGDFEMIGRVFIVPQIHIAFAHAVVRHLGGS